jgi:DNA-binding XRE family transcriptional regulator
MSTNPSKIIKAKREALGLSVEDAGHLAGVTRQTWSVIERGIIQNPTLDTARGIARALQCDLASIWTWAKTPSPAAPADRVR